MWSVRRMECYLSDHNILVAELVGNSLKVGHGVLARDTPWGIYIT